MGKFRNAAWAAALIIFAGGCVAGGSGSSNSSGGLDALRLDVDNLKRDVSALKSQASPAQPGEWEALQRRLAELGARVDRLEGRTPTPPPAAYGSTAPPRPYIGSSEPAPPAAPEPAVHEPAAPEAVAPVLSGGPYEEGKLSFDRKDYRMATEHFQDYLSREPKGANAAAAQFYIGESLYAEQRHEEAILEYQKVVQGFPKSAQVPTSLLKQGLSFQALGDAASARLLYQKVVNSYPKSYAAGVAKERLKNIK